MKFPHRFDGGGHEIWVHERGGSQVDDRLPRQLLKGHGLPLLQLLVINTETPSHRLHRLPPPIQQ